MRTSVWLAVLCLGFVNSSRSQELTRVFFDNTVLHDVRIDLDPDDWAALKANYLDDTYYHATVSSGELGAANVGIRSRGRGSRSPDKPNLDVNVDKYVKKQTFAGLGFFILKANNQDASLMHEAVAFELFRKMGLPAPREAPARLFINGEYFGFYSIVEHEDEDFLDRNLGESGGDLFEWQPNAYYNFEDLGDDPAQYAFLLEPKTNEDSPDYQKFIDLVKAINNSPDDQFVSAVSAYLDLKLYLTYEATENVLAEIDGNWDGVYGTNNFYLYRFEGQDLFQMLVWDKDLTFLQSGRALPTPIDNPLARRLLATPEYRNLYLSQVAKAADLLGGKGGWADLEISRMYALIHDAAVSDPHKQCLIITSGTIAPCGAAAFEQGVQDMRAFLPARAAFVKNALSRQSFQAPANAPVIDAVTLDPDGGIELAPGSIARVRGIHLPEAADASDSILPRTLGRSFIAVDGVRATIVSASSSEALIEIPWDVQAGTVPVVVVGEGGMSNTVAIPVAVH